MFFLTARVEFAVWWHLNAVPFYNSWIIERWYAKWSNWAIAAALVAPESIQFALTNVDMLTAVVPLLSAETKERIRFWLTLAAFILRQIKQPVKAPA